MRRPIGFTLAHVINSYKRKNINVEDLSLRKQVCIAYLHWANRKSKKFGYAFYDLAKKWRKEERRIGGKRTRLEKIARKFLAVKREDLFRESRKPGGSAQAKELVRQKKGFLAPDKWEEHLRKLRAGGIHHGG